MQLGFNRKLACCSVVTALFWLPCDVKCMEGGASERIFLPSRPIGRTVDDGVRPKVATCRCSKEHVHRMYHIRSERDIA
jgi:hypothetical protein